MRTGDFTDASRATAGRPWWGNDPRAAPARPERTSPMLTIDHLTKRYGTVTAVDGLTFQVGPGRVTGFLGPNGAGKSTTLRMLLGLTTPTSGTATINGVRYRDLPDPARTVGAALEADCFHPGRSATGHLRILAI